jgi:hypothetical protein
MYLEPKVKLENQIPDEEDRNAATGQNSHGVDPGARQKPVTARTVSLPLANQKPSTHGTELAVGDAHGPVTRDENRRYPPALSL